MSDYRVVFGKAYYNGKYYSHLLFCAEKKFIKDWPLYKCELTMIEMSGVGELPGSKEAIRHIGTTQTDKAGNTVTTVNALKHGLSELNSRIEYDEKGNGALHVGTGRAIWMTDVPCYWLFTFARGGTSFKVRGDGIFKFSDGTSAKVNTKVVDGAVSLQQQTVHCPKNATAAIFVGTFSNIGTVRGSRIWNDAAEDAFDVPFIDFSGSALTRIEYVEQNCGTKTWTLRRSLYSTDRVPTADEILEGYTLGDPQPVGNHTGTNNANLKQKNVWNIYNRPIRVVSPAGTWKQNDSIGSYGRRTFTCMPSFYRAFAGTEIEDVEDIWKIRDAARDAAHHYTSNGYLHDEFYTKEYPMSAVECFRGCLRLKTAVYFSGYDMGYMYADCTRLEKWERGFWDNIVSLEKRINQSGSDGQGELAWTPLTAYRSVRGMFKGCIGLTGKCECERGWANDLTPGTKVWNAFEPDVWSIPTDGRKGYIVTSNGCFEGCTSLDDYDEIPDWWKLPYGTKCFTENLHPGKETTT